MPYSSTGNIKSCLGSGSYIAAETTAIVIVNSNLNNVIQ